MVVLHFFSDGVMSPRYDNVLVFSATYRARSKALNKLGSFHL